MCNTMYIIAYHGKRENEEGRNKRLENHNNQIEWWLDYDPKLQLNILAMDYDDSDYYEHERVTYADKLDSPIPPASARNRLLELFYNSDEEWAIFADSDAILNQHEKFPHTHVNICEALQNFPDNFNGVDLFWPHWDGRPGDGAFYDKFNNVDPKYNRVNWEDTLRFDRKFGSMKGTLFFLRNNKQRVMMDESFNGDSKIIPGEDDEFSIACAVNGLGTYILRNIMLKEFTAPSTHAGEQNTRKEEMAKGDVIICNKYKLPNDRGKWSKVIKSDRTNSPATVEIPFTKKVEKNLLFDF